MEIEELSSLYSQTQEAFDQALQTKDMTKAVVLQNTFETELEKYQKENPDHLLFIDYISRNITIREPIISDIPGDKI